MVSCFRVPGRSTRRMAKARRLKMRDAPIATATATLRNERKKMIATNATSRRSVSTNTSCSLPFAFKEPFRRITKRNGKGLLPEFDCRVRTFYCRTTDRDRSSCRVFSAEETTRERRFYVRSAGIRTGRLSPSIHKFGDEFIPSGLSAEGALFIATTGTNT